MCTASVDWRQIGAFEPSTLNPRAANVCYAGGLTLDPAAFVLPAFSL